MGDESQTLSRVLDWPSPGRGATECNLIVLTDGGTRRGRCSGSGWVEAACPVDGARAVRAVVLGGTFFSKPVSSFCAEALALQECTLLLTRMVSHKCAS